MAVPFQDGLSQFFDDSGNPLSGGLVYTYRAGTTTPVATYTTRAGTVEHDNPVTLDSAGRVSIWLDRSTAYRFDVKKADGTLIDSVDNIILSDGSGPGYQVETFTATEGQTVINLAGSYTQGINAIAVYVGDGGSLFLASGTDYTETTESSITLSSPLAAGEIVTVILGNMVAFSAGAVADASEVSYTPSVGSATNVKAWLDRALYVADTGATASAFQAASGSATTPTGKIVQSRDFGHRTITIAAADSPYTMDGLPEILLISASAGNVDVTLPSAAFFGTGYGSKVVIRRTDTSTNTVTITRAGADTINGGTSVTLGSDNGYTFVSNGSTAWSVAEALNFDPAGTGATTRAIQTKLQDFPTPSDYSTNATYVDAVDALHNGEFFSTAAGRIDRAPNRLFVGYAARAYEGRTLPNSYGTWLDADTDGPAYLAANAQFLSMTETNRYAIVGAARAEPTSTYSAIALAGAAINQGTGSGARGLMIETQHETTDGTTWGIEIAMKNASGAGARISPYATVDNMSFGIQINGTGDDSFGPLATDPITAGIIFVAAGGEGFQTGIQFRNSLAGAEPEAIAMCANHRVRWYEVSGTVTAEIKSNITTSGNRLNMNFTSSGLNLTNNANATVFTVATSATAVNGIQLTANETGSPSIIQAAGTDTNIDLRIQGKGTGVLRFGTWTSNADAAVNGYVTIKDVSGNVRKLATIA